MSKQDEPELTRHYFRPGGTSGEAVVPGKPDPVEPLVKVKPKPDDKGGGDDDDDDFQRELTPSGEPEEDDRPLERDEPEKVQQPQPDPVQEQTLIQRLRLAQEMDELQRKATDKLITEPERERLKNLQADARKTREELQQDAERRLRAFNPRAGRRLDFEHER